MITENSIYLAPVIMFRRDENGMPSFYYYEEKYIVTDYDKYIYINNNMNICKMYLNLKRIQNILWDYNM